MCSEVPRRLRLVRSDRGAERRRARSTSAATKSNTPTSISGCFSSEHFDVYYYSREEQAARLAAQLAERWYARFSAILGHTFDRRQPLVLYASQPEFAQTNVVSGLLSDTVGGVTESAKRRIAMPFAPTLAETDRVLGHEIAHAFQFDIGRRNGGWGQPLWFVEGMAEYLARGPIDDEASMWLRDAVRTERLPRRERDAARQLSPYQYGHAFWSYLASRFGDQVIERALKPGKQRKLRDRMRHATGLDLDAAVRGLATQRSKPHTPAMPGRRRRPPTPQWAAPTAFGRMQLGPAVSPDGRQAVFFSERDRLSLDLFLGDLATGQVIRKLATTTASARFDSLQPLRSAGAWSPDGRQFAFPATRQGHATIVILDMQAPGGEREIAFDALGQILSIAWSPDGRALAFSALAGGFTDLFQYDLAGRAIAAADRGSVCRSASGVVARRPDDRVCHRTLLERPDDAPVRPTASGDDRRRVDDAVAGRVRRLACSRSTRSGRRMAGTCISSRIPMA